MQKCKHTASHINRASSTAGFSHARGSAMTETVLVLPLIFVVLALLFFFGQAMTRWQRSSVSDRYEAWRQAQYADGPGISFNKHNRDFGSAELLNVTFFNDNADRLDVASRAGRINISEPTDLIAEEVLYLATQSPAPGYDPGLAEDYVRKLHQRLPAWWRIDLLTEHESDVPLYKRFAGAVKHQSTVIDGDWTFAFWMEQEQRGLRKDIDPLLREDVYVNSTPRSDGRIDLYDFRPYAISGVFYAYIEDLEAPIESLAQQGNPMASSIRGIYLNVPDYVGPQLLPEIGPRMLRLNTFNAPDAGQSP